MRGLASAVNDWWQAEFAYCWMFRSVVCPLETMLRLEGMMMFSAVYDTLILN